MENMKEYILRLKAGIESRTDNEIEIDFIAPGYYINVVKPSITRIQEKIEHY